MNWLGDAVMCLPALRLRRAADPETRIIMLSRPGLASFWRLCPDLDAVCVSPLTTLTLPRCAARLSREGFDTAWILPNSFRAALIPFLAGIPQRRGFSGQWRRGLLSEPVPRPNPMTNRHQAWEAAAILSVSPPGNKLPPPRLSIPPERQAATRAVNGVDHGPRLALFPGAARGPAKRWPPGHFIQAARTVSGVMPDLDIVVFGTGGERAFCESVATAIGPHARNRAGETDLIDLAAELSLCHCALCNDSGGMHLAAALGVPVVAIFGLTDPTVTGPLGTGHTILRPAEAHNRAARRIARHDAAAADILARIPPQQAAEAILTCLHHPQATVTGESDHAP